LLFAYLAAHRRRAISRDELIEALWPDATPGADANLRALTSRLQSVLGPVLQGRSALQLGLPGDAWIDLEAAEAAIHRAESSVEHAHWHDAWAPSHIALNISRRGFHPGFQARWIDQLRRDLDHVRLRALECWIQAGLGIGGPELADAETAARKLTTEAPLHETGYILLMRVLEARGTQPKRCEPTNTYAYA
jgi:DNA-binding SARP family transcriptional activator